MDDPDYLELLDIYMDMVERQNEVIYRLAKIAQRAVTDLQLIQNDAKFDGHLEEDIAAIKDITENFK